MITRLCGRDHRNESLQSWFINDFVLGPTGLANPNVSGFYFDDGWANTSQVLQQPGRPLAACTISVCIVVCLSVFLCGAVTAQAIQPWMPKEGFCDHSPIGGATEGRWWPYAV